MDDGWLMMCMSAVYHSLRHTFGRWKGVWVFKIREVAKKGRGGKGWDGVGESKRKVRKKVWAG